MSSLSVRPAPCVAPYRASTFLQAVYACEPVLAAVLLVVALPLLVVVALSIVLLARRSPLIRHLRVGQDGAPLRTLKFRTMWPKGGESAWNWIEEIESGPVPARKTGDPRVTSRFALWCRRHSVDELPQLVHVLRGDMSLVGPRPLTRAELDEQYGRDMDEVLSLRPGLTGLWQVMGRSRLTYRERRRLDLFFARHASPGLYFWILLRTIPQLVTAKDAY